MRTAGRVRLPWVALLVILAAPPSLAQVQPGTRPILIKELTVEGNRRVQDAVILGRVQAKVGGTFNPSVLSEDLRSIFGLGFFDDVQMRVEDFEGGVKVTFVVTERPFVRDVTFSGNKKIATATLHEKLDLKLGAVYNPVEVQRAREKLQDFFEDEGYFEAQISPDVEKFPDGDVRVVFNINEGRRMTIKVIEVRGNRAVTDKLIKAVMATQERQFFILRGTLQRQKLETDIERILVLYNDYGFIQARVESHDIAVDRANAEVTITLNIVEGPQFRAGELKFTGVTLLPEEELRRQLKLKAGDPFSRTNLRDSVRAITDLYSTIGRASADVNPKTEPPNNNLIDVTFEINEGPEVYIERINISGNLRSQDKVLRRELPMAEGDLFTLQKLQRARQKLVNLGYFESVSATTQPGSDRTKTIINIEVTEKPTGVFSIGGGFSSVDSFMGTLDLSQRNFLGRGWEVSLRLRGGTQSQQGVISFTDPWLFDRPLSGGFDLFKTRRVYTDYTVDSTGLTLRLSRPFAEYWRWFAGYTIRNDDISHLNNFANTSFIDQQEGSHVTSVISGSVGRDSRDNVFAPTRGGTFNVGADVAGLGGDFRYFKTVSSTTYFYPIWLNHVLSGRAEGGYGFGFGDQDLPLGERFFLGGPNSIRSFKFRTISPKDQNGIRVGGTEELLGNVEYIIPLPYNIRLAAFFDVGNVWGYNEKFDITVLKYGVGGGFRWLSPFGPIRVDYGINPNRKTGEDFGALNFSVGSPF